MTRALTLSLALAVVCSAQAQVWTPPPGVPAPSFGLVDQPGPVTLPLAAGTQPPNPIPAGSVMELQAGTHNLANRTWTAAGTSAAPVFVTMASGATVIGTSGFKLAGSYVVFQSITATNFKVQVQAHHVAFRDCEFSGHPDTGAGSIFSFTATAGDVVFYRNRIHDNGDKTVVGQADLHGIKVSTSTPIHNVWLIDHESWGNNGDSIQCGSATGAEPWPGHVYVVGGSFRDEGENGVDVKKCTDVVVHGVEISGMTNLRGDPGRGVVIHDDAQRVRVSSSFVHHNLAEGIVSTGADGLEFDGNRVEDNGTGIRAYGSTGDVHHNVLRRNGVALNIVPPVTEHDNLINPPSGPNAPGAPAIQMEVIP